MKTILQFIITIFCLLSVRSVAQEKFTVIGKINGLGEGTKVQMSYGDYLKPMQKEATVLNGIFKFSGTIEEPIYVSFSTRPDWTYKNGKLERFYQGFFLEGGETTITGLTIEEAEVVGGKTQKEFADSGLGIVEEWMYTIALPYGWAWFNKDMTLFNSLIPIYNIRVKKRNTVRDAYVRSHPDSFISLFLLNKIANKPGFDPSNPLFNVLSSKMRNAMGGRQLTEKLKAAKELVVGKIAPDFSQADTLGNQITLSSLRGKYVLVDFWASWCKPCRAENPNLIKAYSQFKDKNFEIIGVSLDDKKVLWTKAILQDQLPWINVSDLQAKGNAVAKSWGVVGVPNNFLISPKGKVIANNLRGEALLMKLREILK